MSIKSSDRNQILLITIFQAIMGFPSFFPLLNASSFSLTLQKIFLFLIKIHCLLHKRWNWWQWKKGMGGGNVIIIFLLK